MRSFYLSWCLHAYPTLGHSICLIQDILHLHLVIFPHYSKVLSDICQIDVVSSYNQIQFHLFYWRLESNRFLLTISQCQVHSGIHVYIKIIFRSNRSYEGRVIGEFYNGTSFITTLQIISVQYI